MAVAAFGIAFTSCSKDETESIAPEARKVEITVLADSELDTQDARSVYDAAEKSIKWGENETMMAFETVDGTVTKAESTNYTLTGTKAEFTVAFAENLTATAFTYNAVLPKTAWHDPGTESTWTNLDLAKLRLNMPTVQNPTATSFDPAADILIANEVEKTAQPTDEALAFRFKRIGAIGKMNVTNLATEANIKSVKITAPGKAMSNGIYYNLSTGQVCLDSNGGVDYSSEADYVELNYATPVAAEGFTAFFGTFPFDYADADGQLIVEITTDDNMIFTKEINIPAGKLAFNRSRISNFTVDMTGIVGYYKASFVFSADIYSANTKIEKLTEGVITLVMDKGSHSSSAPQYYANGSALRYYEGNTLTISGAALISKVQFTSPSASYNKAWKLADGSTLTPENGSVTNTWTGSSTNLVFTQTATARFRQIDVYYTPIPALAMPEGIDAEAIGNEVSVYWNAVANAESYTVSFDPATIEPQTITEGTEGTFTLDYGTEYTISVVAVPAADSNYAQSPAAVIKVTTDEAALAVGNIKEMIAWAEAEDANLATTSETEVSVANYAQTLEGYIAANSGTDNDNSNMSNMLSIVDNSGNPGTGIIVYKFDGFLENAFPVGAKVSIPLTGVTIKNYNGLYELMNATVNVVEGETATMVVPEITLTDFNTNAYMGMVVTVKDVSTTAPGTWTKYTNYSLTDASNNTLAVRIVGGEMVGTRFVAETGNITGVAQKYKETIQLFPRSLADVEAFKLTDPLIETAITDLSFAAEGETKTISFETLNLGTNQVFAEITGTDAASFTAGTVGATSIDITAVVNSATTAREATLTLYIAATEGGEKLSSVTVDLSQVAAGAAPAQYVKVTTAPADWSGQYLIVYEGGNLIMDGSLIELDASKNTKSVTITDGAIDASTYNAYAFTIAAVDGGYSIQSASETYMGKTADSNGINESTTKAYGNTITLNNDGSVQITGTGEAVLRYNKDSGQERFRYYKSTTYNKQQAIHLYKLND